MEKLEWRELGRGKAAGQTGLRSSMAFEATVKSLDYILSAVRTTEGFSAGE